MSPQSLTGYCIIPIGTLGQEPVEPTVGSSRVPKTSKRDTTRISTSVSSPRVRKSVVSPTGLSRQKAGRPKDLEFPDVASPPRWTFLTNHAHVLIVIHSQPAMVLREVAVKVGITERAVQRIVHDLELDGFLQRQKVGRRNQYKVLTDQPLRHPIEAHRHIGELLRLIADGS
jgi:predicted transcriptional regulator